MGEGVFLPQDLAQRIVNYLVEQPFKDVAPLLNEMQAAATQPTEEPSGGDPSTEERD